MFIIRTLFWVSLVILLLPIGQNNEANIIGATKYAIQDGNKFCNRNVDICNISSEVWRSFKYKAAYSYEVVAGVAREIRQNSKDPYAPTYKKGDDQWRTSSLGDKAPATVKAQKISLKSQNTLTANDMEPAWSFGVQPAAKPTI